MRFCESCGKPMEDGQVFCETCGAKMEPMVTVSAPPAVSAKDSLNKTAIIVLSVVCAFLVAGLVIVFAFFVLPAIQGQNGSGDTTEPTQTVNRDQLGSYVTTVDSEQETTVPVITTTTRPVDLTPTEIHTATYEVALDGGVYVRESAYAEATPLGTLQKGVRLTATHKQGEWVRVDFGSVQGWVHLGGLKEVVDGLASIDGYTAIEVNRRGRVTTRDGDGVNMRRGPSTSHEIITPILERQELNVLYEQDGWYYIDYNGINGWVSKEFIRLI